MRTHLIRRVRHRERSMFDTAATVTRPGEGDPIFNPDTGEYDDPPPTIVYDGACLVRATPAAARVVESGGVAVSLRTYDVTLPHGVAVEDGDTVTVTASADPGLVGRALVVLDVPYDEYAVNRRAVAEDRQ